MVAVSKVGTAIGTGSTRVFLHIKILSLGATADGVVSPKHVIDGCIFLVTIGFFSASASVVGGVIGDAMCPTVT